MSVVCAFIIVHSAIYKIDLLNKHNIVEVEFYFLKEYVSATVVNN